MTTKTKTSFYRRLYVAYLIHSGVNTVPSIVTVSGMPRRTAQDTVSALAEIDILCRFQSAKRDGNYVIDDWGAIRLPWVRSHLGHIASTLSYPLP